MKPLIHERQLKILKLLCRKDLSFNEILKKVYNGEIEDPRKATGKLAHHLKEILRKGLAVKKGGRYCITPLGVKLLTLNSREEAELIRRRLLKAREEIDEALQILDLASL